MQLKDRVLLIFLVNCFVLGESTSPDDNDSSPACSEDYRTLPGILWSCVVTIFVCTWISVHPNVPGRNVTRKGWFSSALVRAKVMGIAILTPEVVVAWAVLQVRVAREVYLLGHLTLQTVLDPPKLTMTHGFGISMGAFYDTETEKLLVLRCLKDNPCLVGKLAQIEELSIQDRNKGNAFSKTISIFQISWFGAQCFARINQHLPITLLEVTALAFAVLSIVTYIIWWHKPLNVQYHTCVGVKESGTFPITPDTECCNYYSGRLAVGKLLNCWLLELGMSSLNTTEWNPAQTSLAKLIARFINVLQYVVECIRAEAAGALSGEAKDCAGYHDVDEGAYSFSCCASYSDMGDIWVCLVSIVVVGSVFGAIHCAAWSFSFPSHAEKILWRFSSVAVLIGLLAPVCIGLSGIITRLLAKWMPDGPKLCVPQSWQEHPLWDTSKTVTDFKPLKFGALGLAVYITARISLIILALIQLRSLPPLALNTIQWNTYIPHI
ncbi:hypothetical protein EV421DRAFT_1721499 [Armillaria borealis]|uniref:Uncharacterized protein n=1 Tax=Armillaria borealis TaxID=47425 RepID=A0AA39IU66_9AGAR|nr:hypothetical protein EV421DRAFT_1721499 [Armillaria borealis]